MAMKYYIFESFFLMFACSFKFVTLAHSSQAMRPDASVISAHNISTGKLEFVNSQKQKTIVSSPFTAVSTNICGLPKCEPNLSHPIQCLLTKSVFHVEHICVTFLVYTVLYKM